MIPPKKFREILWGKGAQNISPIPKIVWLYWNGKIDSYLVNLCLTNLQRYLPEYKILLLDNKTINDHLNKDEIIFREDLPLANYTDLLRLNLLDKYGGIWMDASILITENFNWINVLKKKTNADLVGFYSDLVTNNFEFPILETWFLAAPLDSKIIHNWHIEFRKCYYSEKPVDFYPEIKNDPSMRQEIKEDWLLDYLIAYQSAIKVMRSSQDYRLLLISANDTAHFYNFEAKIKGEQLVGKFLQQKIPSNYPQLIKFEKNGRIALDKAIHLGRYKKDSFLFTLISEPFYNSKKILRRLNYAKFICTNILNLVKLKSLK